jgi:hypothetical protein
MAGSAGRAVVTVNELLDEQVVLDIECLTVEVIDPKDR